MSRGNVCQVYAAYNWDNGIFTSSFKSGGEVASIPLIQGEEQRQAFSKEGGAGNRGGARSSLSKMFGSGELDVPSEEGMIAATGGASSISNLKIAGNQGETDNLLL